MIPILCNPQNYHAPFLSIPAVKASVLAIFFGLLFASIVSRCAHLCPLMHKIDSFKLIFGMAACVMFPLILLNTGSHSKNFNRFGTEDCFAK